jgi:hypothetical protein
MKKTPRHGCGPIAAEEKMKAVTIIIECCEESGRATHTVNREGLLHFRCAYCGYELHAGSEYHVKWTPHHGVEVRGAKVRWRR